MSGDYPSMTESKINLVDFRKVFNIPSDFIRTACKVVGIEISKFEDKQILPLYNQILETENDTILLYAFIESKLTGKIETTKKKEFEKEQIDKCSQETASRRPEYLFLKEDLTEAKIIKRPKDAIDVSSSSDLDLRKEDFITIGYLE